MGKSKPKSKGSQGGKRRHILPAASVEAFDKKGSRIRRMETLDDALGGDEDAFHKNRDQVYFNEGQNEDSDDGNLSDTSEVFGLNLSSPPPDEDSDAEIDLDEEEELDEEEDDEEFDERSSSNRKPEEPRGRFAKPAVLQSTTSDSETSEKSDADNSEDEEDSWGANAYHATRRAPGEVDSEDEEALALEAEEARRLQAKSKAVLAVEDFVDSDDEDEGLVAVEREKDLLVDDGKSAEGKAEANKALSDDACIALLVKTSPETLALVDDFGEVVERLEKVKSDLAIVRKQSGAMGGEHPALAVLELEYQALSTYLPTLLFYFSLLLTPSPSPPLVEKVLARLADLRRSIATMDELNLSSSHPDVSDDDSEDEDEDEEDDDALMADASEIWDLNMQDGSEEDDSDFDDEEDDEGEIGSALKGLSDAELEDIMSSLEPGSTAEDLLEKVKEKQLSKSGASTNGVAKTSGGAKTNGASANGTAIVAPTKDRSKKPRHRKVKSATAPGIPALAPLNLTKPSKPSSPSTSFDDDLIEPTSLSTSDAESKASKRHTLRFHLSQVHQKSVKREQGSGRRIGGDDDLPYRSKERARAEVLKRQRHGDADEEGEGLDGEDWSEGDKKRAKGVRGDDLREMGGDVDSAMDGEGYYDLVKKGKAEGKKEKKRAYDEIVQSEKDALEGFSDSLAAGPRGANYKMLSNKGLTPKRAKANRNPRVKKRMMYDKAVKKVATMKSVYKGGLGGLEGGKYEGEKSGISGKLVKSVKL